MLTDKLNIVVAHAPKRTKRKAATAAIPEGPVIVEARDPRQRGDAADRLWQEMVENVRQQAETDQVASRLRNKRARSGQ